MAQKDLNRYQQGVVKRYYEHHGTIQSNKLSELVSELWLTEDEKTRTKLWNRAKATLARVGVAEADVAKVVSDRDLEQLAKLAGQVDAGNSKPADHSAATDPPTTRTPVHDTRTIGQMRSQLAADAGHDSLDEANLKRALRAFRRKLKSMRRDDESSLGNRYVTAGRSSNIVAITPPAQYPMDVWNKLAELGRLKKAGGGTFELP